MRYSGVRSCSGGGGGGWGGIELLSTKHDCCCIFSTKSCNGKNQESGNQSKSAESNEECDHVELHQALETNHTAKGETLLPSPRWRKGRSRAKRAGEIGGSKSIHTRPAVGERRRPSRSSSSYQLLFLLQEQSFSPLGVGVGGTNRSTSEKCQDTDCLCTERQWDEMLLKVVMMLIQMRSKIAVECTVCMCAQISEYTHFVQVSLWMSLLPPLALPSHSKYHQMCLQRHDTRLYLLITLPGKTHYHRQCIPLEHHSTHTHTYESQ